MYSGYTITVADVSFVLLSDMNAEFEGYEKQLGSLSSRIDELNEDMTTYLAAIQKKANDYRTCTT